jgi:hypothetical protein
MRLEIVSDGRVRADLFDSSGYSMISGEARGDVHTENEVPLDLADMARRAKAHRRRPGPCARCYADGYERCMCDPEAP